MRYDKVAQRGARCLQLGPDTGHVRLQILQGYKRQIRPRAFKKGLRVRGINRVINSIDILGAGPKRNRSVQAPDNMYTETAHIMKGRRIDKMPDTARL